MYFQNDIMLILSVKLRGQCVRSWSMLALTFYIFLPPGHRGCSKRRVVVARGCWPFFCSTVGSLAHIRGVLQPFANARFDDAFNVAVYPDAPTM